MKSFTLSSVTQFRSIIISTVSVTINTESVCEFRMHRKWYNWFCCCCFVSFKQWYNNTNLIATPVVLLIQYCKYFYSMFIKNYCLYTKLIQWVKTQQTVVYHKLLNKLYTIPTFQHNSPRNYTTYSITLLVQFIQAKNNFFLLKSEPFFHIWCESGYYDFLRCPNKIKSDREGWGLLIF